MSALTGFDGSAVWMIDPDIVSHRSPPDAQARAGIGNIADDPMRDGFGHAPPGYGGNAEGLMDGRIIARAIPKPETVIFRSFAVQQRLSAEQDYREPGAVMIDCDGPEPRCGKLGL